MTFTKEKDKAMVKRKQNEPNKTLRCDLRPYRDMTFEKRQHITSDYIILSQYV